MLPFLKWLEDQVTAVNENDILTFTPKKEKKEPVRIIRPLSDDEKILFVVLLKLSNESAKIKKEHTNCEDGPADVCNRCNRLSELETKTELIRSIFWESIRMSIKNPPNHLQIFEGWQLAEMPPEDNEDQFDFGIIEIPLDDLPFLLKKILPG